MALRTAFWMVIGFTFGMLAVRGWPPARFVYEKLWGLLDALVRITAP